MSKFVICQVCGKKVDYNLQNCPYCKAIILASEDNIIEENDDIEVFDEKEPNPFEDTSSNTQQTTPQEPEQFMEQPAAQYNPEDTIYQPTSVQQTPVNPQPMMQQQPMTPQPMMQAPTVEMQYVSKQPQQTIEAIPDEEKSNPLGLILALLILGGAGYYFYTHKDTLLPKKENPYGETQQSDSQSQFVTAVNNCTTDEIIYVGGQYSYIESSYEDGWEVSIDVTAEESKNFTSKICTNINNKPVIGYTKLFSNRKIEEIDLSSFNTSQVISFRGMFLGTKIEKLDLRGFDIKSAKNFDQMFKEAEINILNISTFVFPKNSSYEFMFEGAKINTLILGNVEMKIDLTTFDDAEINKIVATNPKTIESLKEVLGDTVEITNKE